MEKTWKFKHMLTAIVHLKQQKWWMWYYLRQHVDILAKCSLSNITFTCCFKCTIAVNMCLNFQVFSIYLLSLSLLSSSY